MKLRMLTFLSLAMTSLAFALTPNGKTTVVNGTTYKADDEGATYEITTNGADVNAVIDVTANVNPVPPDAITGVLRGLTLKYGLTYDPT